MAWCDRIDHFEKFKRQKNNNLLYNEFDYVHCSSRILSVNHLVQQFGIWHGNEMFVFFVRSSFVCSCFLFGVLLLLYSVIKCWPETFGLNVTRIMHGNRPITFYETIWYANLCVVTNRIHFFLLNGCLHNKIQTNTVIGVWRRRKQKKRPATKQNQYTTELYRKLNGMYIWFETLFDYTL